MTLSLRSQSCSLMGLLLALLLVSPVVLAQDGSLDPEFGVDGRLILDLPGTINTGFGIAALEDGRAVIAGIVNGNFAAVRILADGTIDSSFGASGVRQIGPGYAFDLDLLEDGRIVLAGQAITRFGAARLMPNGTLDGSFGTNGTRTIEFAGGDSRAYALAVQPDGGLLLAGTIYADNAFEIGVARLTSDGMLDTSFGSDGRFRHALDGMSADIRAAVLQEDGHLVLAGFARSIGEEPAQFLLMRVTPAGNLDSSFGDEGVVLIDQSSGVDAFLAVAIDEQDRIIAAGTSNEDFAVACFLSNGTPDPSFGTNGVVVLGVTGRYEEIRDLVLIGDEGMLLVGFAQNATSGHNYAALRLHADGTTDQTFGQEGFISVDLTGRDDYAFAAALQPDGGVLITGWAEVAEDHVEMAVIRLREAGRVDVEPAAPVPGFIVTAFPNPTVGRATVELQLDAASTVQVTIVDLLGRHVTTLQEGHVSHGVHQLDWDASMVPPGIYLVRIVAGEHQETRRLTVVR